MENENKTKNLGLSEKGEVKRKSGIDLFDDMPWGTHFCQFYKTKEDLIDILVPYFKAGLESNEFCIWITSEPLNVKDAKFALKSALKNFDDYIEKDQIEILDANEWYTKSGAFDVDNVLEGWMEKEKHALKKGFNGLRLTGNTMWLEKKDCGKFADYEETVNKVIVDHQMLSICSYSLDKCGTSEIIDVVANHQFTMIKREGKWRLIENSEWKKAEKLEKQNIQDLKYLSETAMGFIELTPDANIYLHIAENLKKLVGNSIVIVNSFDPETDLTCVRAIVGLGKLSKSALKILGRDPIGTTYKINETARHHLRSGKYHKVPGKMYELSFGQMPKPICYALEKLFRITEIYSMGFSWSGELYGNVVIILREDTGLKNRKVIEAFINQAAVALQRKRAEEELGENEEKYRSLFENMLEGFAYCKMIDDKNDKPIDFIYLEVNDSFERLMGLKKEDVIGKKGTEVIPTIKDKHPELIDIYGKVAQTGKETKFDIYFKPLDIWLSIKVYCPKKGYFVAVFDNITERKRAEEELLQSKKLASVGMLAAGVAHEINNPLMNISILRENISKMTSDPEIIKKLDLISEQRKVASTIIQSLLNFSRKIEPNFKVININEVISESISSVIDRKSENIAIIESFDPDLPAIKADPVQLRQAFRNIINNAFDAMPQGGKLILKTIQKDEKHVEVKFTDTGIGISKEDLENIFDPFFSKKGIDEGVGLGLSICHGIIEAHKGMIKVESEKMKGTTFIVNLPVG